MAIEDLLHPFLRNYWEARPWLKASAGRLYAWLPERLRLGPGYHRFCTELAAAADPATAGRIARSKLSETLSWAMETVPAYRAYRGLLPAARDPVELLSRLPIITKPDIQRHPERYLSSAFPPSRRLPMVTGGSSRNPLSFHLQKHVTRPKEYAFMRQFQSRVGMGGLELKLSLRGRPVPGVERGNSPLWTYEPIRRQLILSHAHLDDHYMPRYAEALERYRPAYIEAFPSMLYPLARWLRSHPLPGLHSSLRGVLLYSENVYGFQMQLFRDVFGCPVLKHYGHSERVLMAASMPDDERYFFWPTYGWFELADPRGEPITQPGVLGHIVGTSFDNKAMPFLRYRTGDLGVLSASGHAQLPGFPACERIEGRVQEFLINRDSRAISLANIGAAHIPAFCHISAMQYQQDRPGELTLRFVAPAPLRPEEQEQMARALGEKAGCDVTVVRVDSLERTVRGKQRMLIQNLDIARYVGAEMPQ
jgi:phenylacetate-CoA ligase